MFDGITQQILYKYRPAQPIRHVLRLLKYGSLWFSSARAFNDPFDTSITYNLDGLETDLAERWVESASLKFAGDWPEEKRLQFNRDRLLALRTDPVEREKSRALIADQQYDAFGICSLSALRDDLLMWGHYSGNHAGICVGIRTSVLWDAAQAVTARKMVLDLKEVNYPPMPPNINLFRAMLSEETDHIMQFVFTKAANWSYEREFRLLLWDHPNHEFRFGPEVVAELIFGLRTPPNVMKRIMCLARHYNPEIAFFKIFKHPSDYAFIVQEVSMAPGPAT